MSSSPLRSEKLTSASRSFTLFSCRWTGLFGWNLLCTLEQLASKCFNLPGKKHVTDIFLIPSLVFSCPRVLGLLLTESHKQIAETRHKKGKVHHEAIKDYKKHVRN